MHSLQLCTRCSLGQVLHNIDFYVVAAAAAASSLSSSAVVFLGGLPPAKMLYIKNVSMVRLRADMMVLGTVAMPASTRSQKPHARAAVMPTLDTHLLWMLTMFDAFALLMWAHGVTARPEIPAFFCLLLVTS